ncbi:MAG: hypothetical protein ACFE8P_15010 [Promethearchaeota archaeon]
MGSLPSNGKSNAMRFESVSLSADMIIAQKAHTLMPDTRERF